MTEKSLFGTTADGRQVFAYRLSNRNGVSATILDYGCTLQSVCIPLHGKTVDVCLGYDTVREYEQNDGYLGAIVGRYAGRIPKATLKLGEQVYPLCQNDGENHLHGGRIGFDKAIFDAELSEHAVCLSHVSPDGDEGYPAALSVRIVYTLTDDDVLTIRCEGVSNGTTVWNPTSHAYWNLNGHDSGSALDHTLCIPAERYVPTDDALIPLAGEAPVSDTPFDFRIPKTFRNALKTPCAQIRNGFDHSFVLSPGTIGLAGTRGIRIQITTDCKAVQLYTANFLSERIGKGGVRYAPHHAVCLETQSRQIGRDLIVPEESLLSANEMKSHTTAFRFLYR